MSTVEMIVQERLTREILAANLALPFVSVRFGLVVLMVVVDVIQRREGTFFRYWNSVGLIDRQK